MARIEALAAQAARIEALEREAHDAEVRTEMLADALQAGGYRQVSLAQAATTRIKQLETALQRAEALSSKDGLCLNCGQRGPHREYCPFAALREPGAGEEGE